MKLWESPVFRKKQVIHVTSMGPAPVSAATRRAGWATTARATVWAVSWLARHEHQARHNDAAWEEA
jgi:hypothetical protein